MLDRHTELDEFKKLNLSVIAAAHGYEIDKRKTTKSTVMMRSNTDKIAISQKGNHYVYWSVYDDSSKGTVIDFAQKVIEPGCGMGRVRQLLRPYLGGGHMATLQRKHAGRFVPRITESKLDLEGVAQRYSRFVPIAQPHKYLCDVRGIPFELLQNQRLYGRVRQCPRRGSIVFPHWGCPTQSGSAKRCLIGYEIKGPSINLYSKGGKKGLFISAGMKGDHTLAIAESGLDALSYMAVRGEQGLRVASLSGKMNPQQPELVRSAIASLGQGTVVAAFDNDKAGDQLTQELSDLVKGMGRRDITFKEDRAPGRDADWNQVLVDRSSVQKQVPSLTMEFGR